MTKRLTVTPAYGRDYRTAKAAKADWEKGNDFLVSDIMDPYDGKPINKQDADSAGLEITIRFHRLEKLTVVKAA